MDMKFQVAAWLPKAVQREWVRPRHVRPGSEPAERLEPALRCTLESGGEKKEFWVRLSHQATQVIVGKEMFFIRYRAAARQLDFSLTLKRARQVSDPGTNRPASFESDVVLHAGPAQSEHTIRMNHTLDHGGFKVYQTNYRPLVDPRTGAPLLDEDGRLVSLSGFTVADDPGLVFKYAGSCLLVLGIATMFTMRAYFFKPRGASA
jgi:cytochrome c biogenesis protein ResB